MNINKEDLFIIRRSLIIYQYNLMCNSDTKEQYLRAKREYERIDKILRYVDCAISLCDDDPMEKQIAMKFERGGENEK